MIHDRKSSKLDDLIDITYRTTPDESESFKVMSRPIRPHKGFLRSHPISQLPKATQPTIASH